MSLVPTFQPTLPQWRGSTSSEDMNTNFNQILYDLNNLFSEAAALVLDINTLSSRVQGEINALDARLYAVSGVISSYEASASGNKIFYQDFYLNDNIVYPSNLPAQNHCVVDNAYGVVYLPTNNTFSQVYSINMTNGQVQVSPDLVAAAGSINETGSLNVNDSGPIYAFDGDDETVWERDVQYNRDYAVGSVSCVLNVTMPSMSNPYVNRVGIRPFPEGTVNISLITYDTLVTQGNILPGFPAGGMTSVSPTFFSCNNIQPTAFHVYLDQPNWRLKDGYKTFTYGLKEMAIENTTYKSTGRVGVKLVLPSYETGLFAIITSLSTTPSYDNIQYKLRVYASSAEFEADIPIWTSASSPITPQNPLDVDIYSTNTIWVVVELDQPQNNAGSPVLNSLTMTYRTTV